MPHHTVCSIFRSIAASSSRCAHRPSTTAPVFSNTWQAPRLSAALEPAARPGESNALVHDPLSDTEVLVDPLLDLLGVARHLVRFEAGAGEWSLSFPREGVEGRQRLAFRPSVEPLSTSSAVGPPFPSLLLAQCSFPQGCCQV